MKLCITPDKRDTPWEPWFAWRPVLARSANLSTKCWVVFWETVERRQYNGDWLYRIQKQ